MIVLHEHKCAFIHCPKTAGSSITSTLIAHSGPRDIIAIRPNPARQEIIRSWGKSAPQNDELPLRMMRPRQWVTWVRRGTRPRFESHVPATFVRQLIGPARWRAYLTFTVERNPWDKAVSRFYWAKSKNKAGDDFSAFLRNAAVDVLSSFDLYTAAGELVVDRVLRFDRLDDELPALWRDIGIEPPRSVPHLLGESRPARSRDWRSMFSDEDARLIELVCHREIATFGFSFDQ